MSSAPQAQARRSRPLAFASRGSCRSPACGAGLRSHARHQSSLCRVRRPRHAEDCTLLSSDGHHLGELLDENTRARARTGVFTLTDPPPVTVARIVTSNGPLPGFTPANVNTGSSNDVIARYAPAQSVTWRASIQRPFN